MESFGRSTWTFFCCNSCSCLFVPLPTDMEMRWLPSALPNLLFTWKLIISAINHLIFRLKPPYLFSLSPLVIFFLTSGHFWHSHLPFPHISQRQVIKRQHGPHAESLSVPCNCCIHPIYRLQPHIKYTGEISDLQTFLTFFLPFYFSPLKRYRSTKNLNKKRQPTHPP